MLLDVLFGKPQALARVGPAWTLTSPPASLFAGQTSSAGQEVNEESALSLSAVFAAARFRANLIGHLPLNSYQRKEDRREEATSHPAYKVLKYRPNPWMTSQTFRFVMEWNRLMGRAAYAEIQWNAGGNVAYLWPLAYWRVCPRVDDDDGLYFRVDGERDVSPDDMLFIPQITWDGTTPGGFLDYAIESLGLGLSQQQCAATFFGNGTRPNGFLMHEGNPTTDQRAAFRKTWDEVHGGPENQNKTGVLWGGWKWQDVASMNAEQSQLLESRRFTVEEVARWLDLPPHVLRDLTRATFSNIEQQSLDLLIYSLGPTLTAYEQEYDWKLLDPPRLYTKHNVNALMRGDMVSRANYQRQMFMVGKYTINELKEMDDENGIGEAGDIRFVPVNLQPLEVSQWQAENPDKSKSGGQAPGADSPGDGQDGGDNQPGAQGGAGDGTPPGGNNQMSALVADVFHRMLRKEANEAKRAAQKPKEFTGWLSRFYEKHERTVADALSAAGQPEWIAAVAEQHCQQSRSELNGIYDSATPAQFLTAVSALTDKWLRERPALEALEFFSEVDNGEP